MKKPPATDRHATILLVEGEPGIAQQEHARLEQAGYAVTTAPSAAGALERLAEGGIDLIVVEEQIASGDRGLKLARQIREADHTLPFVLVAGTEDEQVIVEALRAGVRNIVRRAPGFLDQLESTVSHVLGQAVMERELGESRLATQRMLAERKRLVAELGAERAMLNSLLDKSPVGMGFFDPELRFLRKNPAFSAMTGLASGIEQGLALQDALPELASGFRNALRKVLATGQSITNEEIAFDAAGISGESRYSLCSFFPVKTTEGTVLGVGSVITDIDDRKRMEKSLLDADQRKDDFLAMLAHELRNPLAPISNAVQILRIEGPGGANMEWSIEVIAEQIRHMTRIIDDLLDVSRITRGTIVLQKERIELERVVDLAVQATRPLIDEYKHELRVTLPPERVLLDADPARLAQALANILNNAAKYTPGGGRIELNAALEGSDVTIAVADNGIGISAELLPLLFDMFVQADQSLSRSRGGLGIGLTVVRSLVEMHNGTVTARSEGAGKGSDFTIRIPVAESPPDSEEVPRVEAHVEGQSPARPLPRHQILVVDDNLRNAASLAKLLVALGQEVQTAHDGREALEMARAHPPDVILLDIGLPTIDGYEVARTCREDPALSATMLVAMTGYGKAADRRRSQAVGFNAHLVKPVGLEDLELLLEHTPLSAPR